MAPSTALVTLTTDFGGADGYVGAMKGVLHRLAPGATIVDIAHDVPRHDVAHAAWVLATVASQFPAGTIHVAVVDPGVGGARLEVIVAAGGQLFVGPDNGLFAYVGAACDGCWAITSTAFRMAEVAPTFHGRDVFAPAAAALARGLPPSLAGPATCLGGQLPWTGSGGAATASGRIVHVDAYGNLISDVAAGPAAVTVAGQTLAVRRTYEDVDAGALIAYVGSAGTVEVAVREGDAARTLGVRRGDVLTAVRVMSGARVGSQFELTIAELAAGGDGVGRDEAGRVTFVPYAAPGDRLRVRVTDARKSFARAAIEEVLAPSPDRVEAPCPLFVAQRCGGCQWQHVAATAQLAAKQAVARAGLRRAIDAGLRLAPPVAAAPPWGWRRRARLHAGRRTGDVSARLGWYAPGSHEVVDVERCPQLEPGLERALVAFRPALREVLDDGDQVHLLIGHAGDVHVVVDGRCPRAAAERLIAAGAAGVVVRQGDRLVGHLGVDAIELEPGMALGADEFAQASAGGNRALIDAVRAAVAPAPGVRVLELFAGGGNFTRHLVAAGADVTANDTVAPTVAVAGARFLGGTAEAAVDKLVAADARFDVILLDPPRTGARAAVTRLGPLAARRIVYVSCDVATLGRDLDALLAAGWAPRDATVYDVMPQTAHVEVVVVLERA